MMNSHKYILRTLLVGACLGMLSCSGPSIRILDRPITATKAGLKLLSSDTLERQSRLTLQSDQMHTLYRKDPNQAIVRMGKLYQNQPTDARRNTLAEMCSDQGNQLLDNQPQAALGYYLDAAKLCDAGSAKLPKTTILYKHAVANVAKILCGQPLHGGKKMVVSGPLNKYRFDVAKGKNYLHPRKFDLLVPADQLKVKGLKLKNVTQEGVGTAMIGWRNATPQRLAVDPYMPPMGHSYPLNARLEFSGSSAKLALQDLMLDSDAVIHGKKSPLEANYSAALASYYNEKKQSYSGFMAMIRPAKFNSRSGMFSIEPFRKDKIPLILVHGLKSQATVWVHFVNQLRADPVVRERYQIILFNYTTGQPFAKNAADLRQALSGFREIYDPAGRNPYLKNSVIAGHSMGGVITNMQIRDSGNRLYKAIFKKDIDQLTLKSKEKEEIRRRLFFKANSDLDRVILLAAPLRGSSLTTNAIGRLGIRLIRLPFDLAGSLLGQADPVDVLTDLARTVSLKSRNSISSLRPGDPVLTTVMTLPVRQGVKIHTIMAQSNTKSPIEDGTDTVVEYKSAYLKAAVSEKIVPNANHTSVLENHECVTEVWRILHLHLRSPRN